MFVTCKLSVKIILTPVKIWPICSNLVNCFRLVIRVRVRSGSGQNDPNEVRSEYSIRSHTVRVVPVLSSFVVVVGLTFSSEVFFYQCHFPIQDTISKGSIELSLSVVRSV